MNKADLRKQLLTQRNQLEPSVIQANSQDLKTNLDHYFKTQPSPLTIVGYTPLQNELSLMPFLDHTSLENKSIYLPRYNTDQHNYEFSPYASNTTLIKGKYDALEPPHSEHTVDIPTIQKQATHWLIPGIGFDKNGTRLGFGKGYYDQFLNQATGIKIGICYNFQLLNTLPKDSWDIPVDILITPEKIIPIT